MKQQGGEGPAGRGDTTIPTTFRTPATIADRRATRRHALESLTGGHMYRDPSSGRCLCQDEMTKGVPSMHPRHPPPPSRALNAHAVSSGADTLVVGLSEQVNGFSGMVSTTPQASDGQPFAPNSAWVVRFTRPQSGTLRRRRATTTDCTARRRGSGCGSSLTESLRLNAPAIGRAT